VSIIPSCTCFTSIPRKECKVSDRAGESSPGPPENVYGLEFSPYSYTNDSMGISSGGLVSADHAYEMVAKI
jgi:hypothetical protein